MSDSDDRSKTGTSKTRTVEVANLARVEGEGALHITMRDAEVEQVRLRIFEPPRFYEAFLRDRDFREVVDITARICGICPVAYQMSACHALEKAMGIFDRMDDGIHTLRNLLYCGEWVESHVLHMFMLHLPDFLGYESALSMAKNHGDLVRRALQVKKVGNEIVAALGGRSVHPVGACVGGFYKSLEKERAGALLPQVRAARDDMVQLTELLTDRVEFPTLDRDYEFVALCSDDEYPMNLGRICSSEGLNIEPEDFLDHIEERHVEHSTALHAAIKGRGPYLAGPLARLNLNHEKLHATAAELLRKVCDRTGRQLPWRNNYLSLLARGIESVHALAKATDILEQYEPPDRSRVSVEPVAGEGAHATEAPRGLLWHSYRVAPDGSVLDARIIPPTSQNQSMIEEDLRELAGRITDQSDEQVQYRCEQLIRNYDPCISCSTHFIRLTRTRLRPAGRRQ